MLINYVYFLFVCNGVVRGVAFNTSNKANLTAWRYKFAEVTSTVPVGEGTITMSTGLKNNCDNAITTSIVG